MRRLMMMQKMTSRGQLFRISLFLLAHNRVASFTHFSSTKRDTGWRSAPSSKHLQTQWREQQSQQGSRYRQRRRAHVDMDTRSSGAESRDMTKSPEEIWPEPSMHSIHDEIDPTFSPCPPFQSVDEQWALSVPTMAAVAGMTAAMASCSSV